MNPDRLRLLRLLRERSLERGDFTLASGARSDYYIDARRTTLSGEGQALIGPLGLELLAERGWEPELVGGLTLGADPVACSLAHAAALAGRRLDAFTVRKQPKGHGTARLIEGPFRSGARVVVVEDSITSGGSALRAAAAVRDAGGEVLGVLALVDREEGGAEALSEEGLELAVLFSARDLLEE